MDEGAKDSLASLDYTLSLEGFFDKGHCKHIFNEEHLGLYQLRSIIYACFLLLKKLLKTGSLPLFIFYSLHECHTEYKHSSETTILI